MKNKLITLSVIFLAAFVLSVLLRPSREDKAGITDPAEVCRKTWEGYKHVFIEEGKVIRPREADTVSEGQAYAMLRAVWMGDKETFDACYAWSERHLSRQPEKGDNLLAWHWQDGQVADWMPAADADIDYALALIFADARWHAQGPAGLTAYGSKARSVLEDVLRLETYRNKDSRLYLLPWIIEGAVSHERLPLNPSYYSPAHFRIFFAFTKDRRWNDLLETTYFLLNSLSRQLGEEAGAGLIPDWCSVDARGALYPLEGKNSGFGWEAVRVPLRVALDCFWFDSIQAREFLQKSFVPFIEAAWKENGAVFSEYGYNGKPRKQYESPLFYASYACALLGGGSRYAQSLEGKNRSFIVRASEGWLYSDPRDYYTNSLSWFAEGINSGIIRDMTRNQESGE
ncbi:MAG: glycosyl hydrolase family 8 [Candidatus Omnitrophica bacterium]|nr:glycosyl hydrolase family 8 [Candidatus Omnitrophota bacterium]